MTLAIQSIEQADAKICDKIAFQAHKAISSAHGYPSEQPSIEFAVGMIKTLLANPYSWGFYLNKREKSSRQQTLSYIPPSPVVAIGPLTVEPSAEGGVGRALMEAALMETRKRDYNQVRLVQSPSHLRSFALYTKCGFALCEPLFLMQGSPSSRTIQKRYDIRPS